MPYNQKYPREFYLQNTFVVAQNLLGSYLCTCIDGLLTCGKIVEVEPYIGDIDKASHSYLGKRTPRTEIQFGLGGHAYIFLVYGMYTQFCVVTGVEDVSDVILIRAIEPVGEIEVMKQRRKRNKVKGLTDGPGKLCMALNITMENYGVDLCGSTIWISPSTDVIKPEQVVCTKRVGIDYAEEFAHKLWRFYISDNKFISKKGEDTKRLSMIDPNEFLIQRDLSKQSNSKV